jgi:hypothetical protein
MMDTKIATLIEAIRQADAMAGTTSIKPAGQPWRQVKAIPVDFWERVREALEKIPETTEEGGTR